MKTLIAYLLGIFCEWIPTSIITPPENELVWLYNKHTKSVTLGMYHYLKNEGWIYIVTTGHIFDENGMIQSECIFDDDYEFTHFSKLPKLPFNKYE